MHYKTDFMNKAPPPQMWSWLADNINYWINQLYNNYLCNLVGSTLTGYVNGPGDEAILSELPGLPDIYNHSFFPAS